VSGMTSDTWRIDVSDVQDMKKDKTLRIVELSGFPGVADVSTIRIVG
jgi:hypothetical protein